MSVPRVTQLAAQSEAPQRTSVAMAVIMTGVLMTAVDTTIVASRSISRGLAFAIFVGSTSLHGALAVAFTSGLHAAFYASMGFMALAAGLSALRARRS